MAGQGLPLRSDFTPVRIIKRQPGLKSRVPASHDILVWFRRPLVTYDGGAKPPAGFAAASPCGSHPLKRKSRKKPPAEVVVSVTVPAALPLPTLPWFALVLLGAPAVPAPDPLLPWFARSAKATSIV